MNLQHRLLQVGVHEAVAVVLPETFLEGLTELAHELVSIDEKNVVDALVVVVEG